jgi:hypothetical protein
MNIKIEQYVRYPNTLSPEEKLEVEQLLQTSEAALNWKNWLVDYYAEFDLVKAEFTKPKMQNGKLLKLNPITVPSFNIQAFGDSSLFTLAAKNKHTYPLSYLKSYLSENEQLLIRVFKNSAEKVIEYFAIPSEPNAQINYSLFFPQLQKTIEFGALKHIRLAEDFFNGLDIDSAEIQLLCK